MTAAEAERVAAFEAVLREHDRLLRAFACRLVGRDVDDVLQSAYLAAFRAMPQFRGESSLSSWLHRIVYTTAINHIRSHERRVRRDELGALRESGDDFAVETASRLDLEAALSRIPVDQRAALLLVDVQGFSYDDAARILGVAPGTVASRLSRARGVVRAALMTEREGA